MYVCNVWYVWYVFILGWSPSILLKIFGLTYLWSTRPCLEWPGATFIARPCWRSWIALCCWFMDVRGTLGTLGTPGALGTGGVGYGWYVMVRVGYTRPGKHTKNEWNITMFNGEIREIHYFYGPFSIAMLVYQRAYLFVTGFCTIFIVQWIHRR